MVNIPTARDVGYSDPRSGRVANSGPTPMVGAALADAGQVVVKASYSLQELAEREKVDVANDRSNAVSTSLTRFMVDEEERFLKAREQSSESGIGFTRQFMEGYQQRANAFAKENFEGLSKDAQTGYLNNILSRGNTLFEKADLFERETKGNYYTRTTNTNLDALRTQIQNNAAGFDDLKRKGLEDINSANMPEPWKAARRQQWEADAAESQYMWDFSQDPTGAVQRMRGQSGSVVDKIIGVESGGNPSAQNPNSSAAGLGQFIDSTWLAMIRKYRPDIAEGKSAKDIIALKRDGSLSREMTQHYVDENQEFLKNQGLQTTDGNTYLAHFLGPRGAAQVLKSDPSTPITSILGQDAVNANPFLKGKSAADLIAWADKKMGGAGVTTEYDAIPHGRRQILATWGETEYGKGQADQKVAAKSAIDEAVINAPIAIRNTGIYSGAMPTQEQFTAVFGDKGQQQFDEFQQGIEVSRTSFRMQTMSAAEIAAQVKAATPVSSGANAAFEQGRYEVISTAAQQTLTARNADPAAYVRQAFPSVDAAWKAAKDADGYKAAVSASIAAQQQLGVDIVRPLPKAIAAEAAGVFNDLRRPEADRIAAVRQVLMATDDLEQRRVMFDQLVDSGLPDITEGAVEAMSRGDEGAAWRLFQAAMVDPEKLPGQGAKSPDVVRQAIQDMLMAPGMPGDVYYGITNGSAENYLRAQRDAKLITNAVNIRMINKENLYDAIDGVSKDLFGNVQVVEGDDRVNAEILIPKDQDPKVVLDGLVALQGDVKAALRAALKPPGAEPEGVAAGLVTKGNIDLENRAMARKPDGSITTGRPLSLTEGGIEVLLPTVSPEGRMLNDDEAIEMYRQTGEFLGKFDSPANAAAYGKALHTTLENFHFQRASGMSAVRNAIGLNYIGNVMAEGFFRNSDDGFVFINPYVGAPVTDKSGITIVFKLPKHDPSAPPVRYWENSSQ